MALNVMERKDSAVVCDESKGNKSLFKRIFSGKNENGYQSMGSGGGSPTSKRTSLKPAGIEETTAPFEDRTNEAFSWNQVNTSSASPAVKSTHHSTPPLTQQVRFHQSSDELPDISDPGRLLTPSPREPSSLDRIAAIGKARPRFARLDRAWDTPELPKAWTKQHDRAICYLDVRGYDMQEIITRLRNFFPELIGPLTPEMIDNRLRQLDENIDITYFADAMRELERSNNPRGLSVTPARSPASRTVSLADLRERTAVPNLKVKASVQ